MRRNPDFLLRDVAGALVLVPVGKASVDFPGMIPLNATGAYFWELLENEQTIASLVEKTLSRYEVDETKARQDVEAFVAKLMPTGAILEN